MNPELIKKCEKYPKDSVDPKIIEELRPIIESKAYDSDKLKNASMAAYGLGKWVWAIVEYYDAMVIYRPKEAALRSAEASLKEAQDLFNAAQAWLREVEE